MADSVRQHLQNFITSYRTNKARIDVVHYTKLAKEAKKSMIKVFLFIVLLRFKPRCRTSVIHIKKR